MEQVVIARYGEVHLKGRNRGHFINALTKNLKKAVGDNCNITFENGRYIFSGDADIEKISKVFGITSVSPCAMIGHKDILDYLKTLNIEGTFKCEVKRADKTFPHTSMEFSAIAGGVILDANKKATVDVKNPETTIYIDIRENDRAYVYSKIFQAVGGMPVGTAGRALVLLSGGIDSPVAAYLAAKRGLDVQCIHFASPPYTSELALDKVKRLGQKVSEYCGDIKIHVVPFTEIQQQIRDKCREDYLITIMRRFMIAIAEHIAKDTGCDCIFTGENLSQVASQTIAGITTNNVIARSKPILRPLITYDKSEIITLAKQIDTYNISIEPHADCCTVFVPSSPAINPTVEKCEKEERKLDIEGLIKRALDGVYTL